MIQRRIKRRPPTVVIITCTVKVISVPANNSERRRLRQEVGGDGLAAVFNGDDDARWEQNDDDETIATAKKCHHHDQHFVRMATPMENGKGKGMREKVPTTTATKGGMEQNGTMIITTTNNNTCGNNETERNVPKQQHQLLFDSKSAENVRHAVEKMRHKEQESLKARADDVFSQEFVPKKYSKNSAEYGRPPPGSLTEMRANKASRHIAREMLQLCEVIEEHGHRRRARNEPSTARVVISFGDLFNIYQFISDKVVGMLLRARKHGMVDFEGEMLFQRRDEAKMITLLISHEQIQQALSEFAK